MASHAPADSDGRAAGNALLRPPPYPKLEALDYFREVWTKVSTERTVAAVACASTRERRSTQLE